MRDLQYPDDRVPGYVQLSVNGVPYVCDKRESGNEIVDAIKYCQAFLILMNRLDKQ